MISEQEIQEQILSFLSDEQSFEELEDWLVDGSRIQYLDNSESVRAVLGKLRFAIFQFIEGEVDERKLRVDLHELIQNREVSLTLAASATARPARPRYGSSASTEHWVPLYT